MHCGTVLVVHRSSVLASDMINSLRSAGLNTYVADPRDDDFLAMAAIVKARTVVIDQYSVDPEELGGMIAKLEAADHIERIIVIGNGGSRYNALPDKHKLLYMIPPFDTVRLLTLFGLINKNLPGRECQHKYSSEVEAVLISVGLSRRMTGFSAVKETVNCIVEHSIRRMNLSKEIYPKAAQNLGMSAAAVERAIRVTVNEIMQNDPAMLFRILMLPKNCQMTNKRFLYAAADRVREIIIQNSLAASGAEL